MQRRIQRRPSGDSHGLPASLDPVLARVLAARGLRDAEDMEHRLADMVPVGRLDGLNAAVDLLCRHMERGSHILVVGDFDADGATSTALVLRTFRALGYGNASYLVPNRFEYGYGLTPEIVDLARDRGAELLITVDNGISSLEGVARANSLDIPVLVTDHHLPGDCLPEAAAIVNPNAPGEGFPSKCLAGVGVAFYLMAAISRKLDKTAPGKVADLLDLVALGTVADLVPLDRNNRILVQEGLRRIRAGRGVPGIRGLLDGASRDWRRVVSSDLGYGAAPRLNAAGRLDDMRLGIECLLCDDPDTATEMVAELSALNTERREIEARMQQEAMAAVEQMRLGDPGSELPSSLCLFDERWHQGVVGLVASRVKDRVHRPVIAFARADENSLKGSARSVRGLHIRDALDRVATRHPDLLAKFGGHAMAAGLSLESRNLEAFRRAFDEEIQRWLPEMDLEGTLLSDGELGASEFTLATAESLRSALPWGQGFPEPLFDGAFRVRNQRIVGERHVRLKVCPEGSPRVFLDAIAFNQAEALARRESDTLRLLYRLDANEYRGRRTLQLVVEYLEPV